MFAIYIKDKQSQLFEKLKIEPSLFGFQNCDARAICPFRILSDYEIIYNIGGETIVTIENEIHSVKSGELILIPNFTRHKIDTPKDNPHKNYWVHFSVENSLFSQNFITTLFSHFDNYTYKLGIDSELINLFKKMNEYYIENSNFSYTLSQIYFKELIIYLIKKLKIELTDEFCITNEVHYRVIKYVSKNFKDIDNLSEIATNNNISLTYCNFIFRKYFGVSPAKYIMTLKLKTAERQLRNSNKTIKTISDELNFSSPYHFSNTFKLHYGMTPKKFRSININF